MTSLETVVLNDRAFVIAGGSDDGVSVFELLPGGRLLIHDTMPDSFTTTLANVSAIGAMAVDGQIQVFVGSGIETGVTQFALDPGPTGTTRIGNAGANSLVGTVTGEVLAGQAGNDTISGGAGDDVLMDGAGQDTLIGGTGNDIFVLDADGTYDEIRDFNPAEDRIDLTAWPMLRNLGQITFTTTGNGAILEFGSEQLRVYSHDGLPLAQHQLLNNNLISLTRVLAATPEPAVDPNQIAFLGDGQSNEIMANDLDNILGGGLGNDTLTGGAGNDLFIYSGGADVIEDFSGDLIQIERSQYSGSVDALLASATVVSGNLVFDFGGGYSLTLTGVTSTAGLEGRVRIGAADPGHDVSGDGTSDILLRSATGALGFYDMAGGTPSWSGLGAVATSWTVATTGDFNGDGTDDILLRNSSGATGYYDMDGGTPTWVGLGTVATSWTAIGSDDFNGDGIDDILWRSTTGAAGYYDMDGGTPTWVGLGSVPTSWDIVGTGDFNGDGTDDILWRNSSGVTGFYDMDGGTPSWVGLGSVATNWSVVATGDFNGDGTDDILWRNSSGVTGFYDMDGGTPSWVGLGTVALSWDIVGTGDFNGDGTDDILWRNTSGALGMYDMDNGNPTWVGLGALDLQWDVTGQFVDEFIF